MENRDRSSQDENRPEVPVRTDGFFGVIERQVEIADSQGKDPDLTNLLTSADFRGKPEAERKEILDYVLAQEYATQAQLDKMMAPAAVPEAKPEVPVVPPRAEAVPTSDAVPVGDGAKAAPSPEEPRTPKEPTFDERLKTLQRRGFQLTRSDILWRSDKGHRRIFVGYGAEIPPGGTHFALREAYGERNDRKRKYDASVRTTGVAIPREAWERWENDPAFQGELVRLATAMRDELEGERTDSGEFRAGTNLVFDGIKNGALMDEPDAVKADLSLLKPKWKYRLNGKNNYDEDTGHINPRILEIVATYPKDYFRHPKNRKADETAEEKAKADAQEEYNTWYGRELQTERDAVISRELAKIYGPKAEAEPVAQAAAAEAAPVPAAETAKQESAAPAVPEKHEMIEWPADESFEVAQAAIKELEPLFENKLKARAARKEPYGPGEEDPLEKMVVWATALTTEHLRINGHKGEIPKREPSRVEVLGIMSHAFSDYFAAKELAGEDTEEIDEEVFDMLLHEALAFVAHEAFGGKAKDAQEMADREKILEYITRMVTEGKKGKAAAKLMDIISVGYEGPASGFEIKDEEKLKAILVRTRDLLRK